jgi:hypothetical protein
MTFINNLKTCERQSRATCFKKKKKRHIKRHVKRKYCRFDGSESSQIICLNLRKFDQMIVRDYL